MSRDNLGLDRVAGGRPHHSSWQLTTGLVLMGLAFSIGLMCDQALADPVWQDLWTDNFDHSMNDGWEIILPSPSDRLDVRPEDAYDISKGAQRCDPENNVLYGSSLDCGTGHGFAACSPSLRDMGLKLEATAYSIGFRYLVPNANFCWTVPLSSPDVNLVISECTAGGTLARLGVVDERMLNFRQIAEIEIGVWKDFTIHVRRLMTRDVRVVTILIDGEFIDRFQVSARQDLDRGFAFVDLPGTPVEIEASEVDAENPPQPFSNGCFGSGVWDDVQFSAFQEPDAIEDRSDRLFHCDPNPFNPSTTVHFQLDSAVPLDVTVFDVRGRRVNTLYDGVHEAGPVELRWDGRDQYGREVSSGVYLIRVATPNKQRVVRGVLVR